MQKISITVARLLFVLSLAALILSATIAGAINNRFLYQYGFEKYQVSETTGLSATELEKTARGLIRYFNSDEELISLTATKDGRAFTLFNQREVIHLKDVKGLVWLDYRVLIGASLYVLGYALLGFFLSRPEYRRFLARGVLGGSALLLGLMLALGLGAIFSFERLFLQFHRLSFTNDFWQLDPARDYLLMLFPQGFWFDAFAFSVLTMAAVSLALGAVAWRYLARHRDGQHSPRQQNKNGQPPRVALTGLPRTGKISPKTIKRPVTNMLSHELATDVERLLKTLGPLPEATPKPRLIVVSGLPGTGKTHLAARLSERLPYLVLESDRLRKALFPRPTYLPAENTRLFRTLHQLITVLLAKGVSLILDATNLSERNREYLYQITDQTESKLILVRVEAPPDLVRKRLTSRLKEPEVNSDADWSVYQKMRPTVQKINRQHFVVDTSRDIGPALEKIVREA